MLELDPSSNLGDAIMCDDPHEGLEYALRGQDLSRQLGMRYSLGISVLNAAMCLLRTGEWDRAAAMVESAVEDDDLDDFIDPARGGGRRPGTAR